MHIEGVGEVTDDLEIIVSVEDVVGLVENNKTRVLRRSFQVHLLEKRLLNGVQPVFGDALGSAEKFDRKPGENIEEGFSREITEFCLL